MLTQKFVSNAKPQHTVAKYGIPHKYSLGTFIIMSCLLLSLKCLHCFIVDEADEACIPCEQLMLRNAFIDYAQLWQCRFFPAACHSKPVLSEMYGLRNCVLLILD